MIRVKNKRSGKESILSEREWKNLQDAGAAKMFSLIERTTDKKVAKLSPPEAVTKMVQHSEKVTVKPKEETKKIFTKTKK
jgi:hypothetical protein